MRANPEIVIQLAKNRYAALYRQWEQSIAELPTTTQVRLRLLSLLRAGIVCRENLGIPEKPTGETAPARARRRGRTKRRRAARRYYVIRCRVDPRLYPDVLDEWRALGKRSRSEIFAEYLRIGLRLKPEELRSAAQRITRNMGWQPNATVATPEPGVAGAPRTETVILSDPGKTGSAAAQFAEEFQSLDG